MRTIFILLTAAVVGVGCDSPKTYQFGGGWQTSGALNGFFLALTQTGQQVAGEMWGAPSTGTYGPIAGVVANGTVSFTFSYIGQSADGTNGVTPSPQSWQFTGHFVTEKTVSGTISQDGHTTSLILTRLPFLPMPPETW